MDARALDSRVLTIGLTGGIGSGKSTVAKLLQAHGASLVDTDSIARDLTAPNGAAVLAIVDALGVDVVDSSGALDRARMREVVFNNLQKKRLLESILHPLIDAEAAAQAQAAYAAHSVCVVFDVPLLVEVGERWRARVDKVLVVDCNEATQVTRVVARSGWAPEAVRAVMAQQATRTARRACADAIVFNDAIALGHLAAQVHGLWNRWTRSTH